MKRVARGRITGLKLLSSVHIDISLIRNISTRVLSSVPSTFRGSHEILRSSQASSQICVIFEREKVDIPFVGRWNTCNPLDFLF